MGSLIPLVLAVGGFITILGAAFLYLGMKTPEDKKVNMGFGTYYDRTGICWRAIMVLIIGVIALVVGLFGQMT